MTVRASAIASWGAAAVLLVSGCAVDLLVGGEPSGTTGSQATEEGDSTTAPPGTTETVAESSTGIDEPGTSTGIVDPSTTTGEENTSTGEMAEGTTTGEVSCEGLPFGDCNEIPYCLWYGEPEAGECAFSPCEMKGHECFELAFEACVDALPCAWVGEPKMGECGPLECVPCEVLTIPECEETPTCFFDEMEMACLPVR